MSNQPIAGAHVLIVEDEPLIALDVEQICLDEGAASVHVARSVSDLSGMDLRLFSLAILDRSVGLSTTYDLARELRKLGIPFVFTSGLSDDPERNEFPGTPLVQKPYSTNDLVDALARLLRRTPSRA